MLKKILFLGFILSFINLFAQHTVTGEIKPANDHSWLILYKLNGVSQKYINDTTVLEGKFSVEIPKNSPSGMYRLLYDNINNKFVDFIYNKEDISLVFHPDYPMQLVKFSKSGENILYQKYIEKISSLQNRLDSLQVSYFQENVATKELKSHYSKELIELKREQKIFETESKGKLVNHFIVANNRYYSDTLIKSTNDYLNVIKTHYFDYINFDDSELHKSSLFVDRIMDYVFYLNTSNDKKTLIKLRKEGVTKVLSYVKKTKLKKDIIESLLYTFAQQEDLEMVSYLIEDHFKKLPVAYQDYAFKEMINDMLKTTIGNKAPNIVWTEKGKEKSLYKLKDKKYYLVVFWSTTCPHCLQEMPLIDKYLKDKSNITSLAIGLETEESKVTWTDEKYYYEQFTHILGENKYENKYVKDYGVSSTPNFYLLNSDKIIIAKPYDVKAFIKAYDKLLKKSK